MASLSSLPLRIGHSGVCRENKLYLFGGYVKNPDITSARALIYTNDLIEIDIATQLWRNLTIDQQLVPCARNCHSAYLKNRDEMILFGGKSNGFHKDVWLYEFEHNLWTQIQVNGGSDLISPRYGQSAVVFKNHLFVFGGYDNNSFTSNELFKLNLTTLEWKVVEIQSSSTISKRYHHASVLNQETGEWYIHGGKKANSIINDTIKISLDSLVESGDSTKCNAEVIASNLSEHYARYGHSMVLEGNKLFSVGGCNRNQDFMDCTYLDLEHISEGWKIVTNHSLSSIFNSSNKDEAQPVLHALIQIHDTDSVSYFVVGGFFQKTSDILIPPVTTTVIKKVGKSKVNGSNLFNVELFNEMVNDDIFRIVLSFLEVSDLMKLHSVSKSLRICSLTTEDQYWKEFYLKKINDLKEKSSRHTYDFILPYLQKNSNYKENLIEVVQSIMSAVEKKSIKTTLEIEKIEQLHGADYVPKTELLKYSRAYEMLKRNYNYYSHKVVQVGDGAVGKTTLFMKYVNGTFPEEYIPTVFENHDLYVKFEGNNHLIGLWDTAGPEEYDRIRPLSYPGTSVFLVSFSCISENSLFNLVEKWVPEVRRHCPDTPIILVNTKLDYRTDPILNKQFILQRERKPITFEQGELMAKKMGCATYIETSSKTGYGLDDLTEVILKTIAISRDENYSLDKQTKQKKCMIQ